MKDMWDSRYSRLEYVYGESPNLFFSHQLLKLTTGKLLLPAEGEGRNAVFAAKSGWHVEAFDFSESAKAKAMQLASKHKVVINYDISSFDDFKANEEVYDCIGLTYVHMPKDVRKDFHGKLTELLSHGGTIILEGFSKNQIKNTSGGPKDISMLFSVDELKSDFNNLIISSLYEEEVLLEEGEFHKGIASVIRLVAHKPINKKKH